MHEIVSEVAEMFLNVLGLTDIDKFSKSFTHFSKWPVSFPIFPIVKSPKHWILLEYLAHIKRISIFN